MSGQTSFKVENLAEAAQKSSHRTIYMNLECILKMYEAHPEKLDNLVKECLKKC